ALECTFCGFNLLHFMHLNVVVVVAHIPWLLTAIDVLLTTTNRRELALAQLLLSLATGSELLVGHPQFVFFTLVIEGAFVAWRLRNSGQARRLGLLVWAMTLGVGLGAVQAVPTLHAFAESERSHPSLAFRLAFSLERANLMQFWSPYGLSGRVKGGNVHEFGLYNGSVCTIALVWLFIRRHSLARFRSLVVACAVFVAVMLLFALGSHGGIYPWVARLPLVSLIRVPSRWILLVHFGLAILAALAFADVAGLTRGSERLPFSSLWPLGVVAALSLGTLIIHVGMLRGPVRYAWAEHLAPVGLAAVSAGLILVACVMFVAAARGSPWAPIGLVILTVVDLSAWGFSSIWCVPPQTLHALA